MYTDRTPCVIMRMILTIATPAKNNRMKMIELIVLRKVRHVL